MPLSKSDAGWRRFQERTNGGTNARRARMDHRVRKAGNVVAQAAKARSVEHFSQLEPELEIEFAAVSYCGDCDGPCTCE